MTDAGKGHKGITAFILPMDARAAHRPGRQEARHPRLAVRQSSSTTAPSAKRRAWAGRRRLQGRHVALDGGRIGIASQALGIARAAFEDAPATRSERKTFGKPIAQHQAIQFKLADMGTEIDAARLLSGARR